MIGRRQLLTGGAGLAGLAAGASLLGLSNPGRSAGEDYRALVVLFLMGGNDGNNLLVPTDAMYNDYQVARANLALPRASLAALPGTAAGHSFGLHSALAPLVPLYSQQRLAFIASTGPLVQPTTALQARNNAVPLPPFLLSHSDQVAIQQGWTVRDDTSGWAGRGLELLASPLRNPLSAVTMDNRLTLVQGRRTRVSFMPETAPRRWGIADLAIPQTEATQALSRMTQWQFRNQYQAEYVRNFAGAVADATRITEAMAAAKKPTADFGSTGGRGSIAMRMGVLASLLPVFKSMGFKRQVFLVSWGSFDTHTNQRGNDSSTQDAQYLSLAKALTAFDETNRINGVDMNVVTLMMSDFGRTVRPGSGGGKLQLKSG